jgi:hypothetical protein
VGVALALLLALAALAGLAAALGLFDTSHRLERTSTKPHLPARRP